MNCLDSCKYLQEQDGCLTVKKKHQYYAQVQLGMAVLNLKQSDFILYAPFDNSFVNIPIEYNEEYTKNLIQKLQYNYFHKMLHVICTNKI